MTWGWNARCALPVDANATGTTGGGGRGSVREAGKTAAWPRYEAEYLKRALQSERYKYDTEGLDTDQRQVYLDRVTAHYKEEADECLKAEFEQWLQGLHDANDSSKDQEYKNADGKPVRRWVMRSKESEDPNGCSKVGQARAGWTHTPWGRSALTHLPGVRDYLREQKERANDADLKMQLLAEFGPQNIDEAWKYFKHWVKGRPLSDAVALPARFDAPAYGTRSDLGNQMPQRMYAYDPDPSDRQPEVYATDRHAYNAAVAPPGEEPVPTTSDWEDRNVRDARQLREQLEGVLSKTESEARGLNEEHIGEVEIERREDKAEALDAVAEVNEAEDRRAEESQRSWRFQEMTAPSKDILPSLS